MKKTLIFGHKKPDTDSVMSAISLSYLKNVIGDTTEPRLLGHINKETAYALNYFNLKEPKYLNDVKVNIVMIDFYIGVAYSKNLVIKKRFLSLFSWCKVDMID